MFRLQGSAYAMPWVNKATTILQSWFGGNETGAAIADVLTGKVNPSGRMPLSFPHQMEDCTAFLNWQAENGKVYYGEGLFVSLSCFPNKVTFAYMASRLIGWLPRLRSDQARHNVRLRTGRIIHHFR